MTTIRPGNPRSTTLWAGSGVVIVGALALFSALRVVLPLTQQISVPLFGHVATIVSALVLLAAMGILAFGVRGESGIVGRSAIGKGALLAFGIGALLLTFLDLVPVDQRSPGLAVVITLVVSAQVLCVGAAVVASIVIARAGILRGFARWAFVIVAASYLVLTGLSFVPMIEVAYALAALQTALLRPASLILLGLAYVLQGRSDAIRHRLQVINAKW
jgi:hypothetical protein